MILNVIVLYDVDNWSLPILKYFIINLGRGSKYGNWYKFLNKGVVVLGISTDVDTMKLANPTNKGGQNKYSGYRRTRRLKSTSYMRVWISSHLSHIQIHKHKKDFVYQTNFSIIITNNIYIFFYQPIMIFNVYYSLEKCLSNVIID